jgi:hypothetical protein
MSCTIKNVKKFIAILFAAILIFPQISTLPTYASVMSHDVIQTDGTSTCTSHAYDLQSSGLEGSVYAYAHTVVVGSIHYRCSVSAVMRGYFYICLNCYNTTGYFQQVIYYTHSFSNCPES